ncbi:MAG TPA: LysR family transcriptional regulator [Natronosporangium sp.]
MLDLVRLRVLAAVAAHGSVTKAAEHPHYAQPSVSHHLARLEAETGARLVQRVGRGIRLTPEGELLARRAAEIVGRVDAAEADLAAMVGLRTGRTSRRPRSRGSAGGSRSRPMASRPTRPRPSCSSARCARPRSVTGDRAQELYRERRKSRRRRWLS